MKRYEIENTTSINNIKNIYNELVKSLDCLGYTNLLRNNYFKNKFYNEQYGVSGQGDILLSKWIDDTAFPHTITPTYDGTSIDGTDFKFLSSENNTDIFGIIKNKSIYQIVSFNDLERLSHNGILNLSMFYIKKSVDSYDATIKLQYTIDEGTNWVTMDSYLIDSESSIFGGVYTDTEDYYYTATSPFVISQHTSVYNIKDDTLFRYVDTTNEIFFRVIINNPTGASSDYKYLMNTLAYFGRSDSASLVKNIDDSKSGIEYDATVGEYYISNDGQDKVYLSVNKYFLTVGPKGSYSTLQLALDSIALDESATGDSRIIYLTGDISLAASTNFSNVTGYNLTIMGNGFSITCPAATVFSIVGGSGTEVKNVTIENVKFIISSASEATIPLVVQHAENINFKNCYVDGDFKVTKTLTIDHAINCNFNFTEFKNYGYDNSTLADGYGVYVTNSTTSNINIQSLVLDGGTAYSSTDLIGVYIDSDTCDGISTTVQTFTTDEA